MHSVVGFIALGICIGAAVGMTVQFLADRRCMIDIQNIYEAEIHRIREDYKHREKMQILRADSEKMQLRVSSSDWIDVEPLPISKDWREVDFSGRF